MKFDPCKLSLIRNFADRELYLYVDGINSFVKNIDPSKISSYGGKIKNINDALYCYIYPIYKDKNNEYVRNYEFSEQALLNQSSSLPSNLATEASFYRVLGILQQNKIALTTVAAELLLTKKIFVQEYALIILSKQWIWADNNCRKNLLIALYELFTNKVNSLQFLYEAKVEKINNFSKELFLSIEGRPFNNNDDIDFSRYDILRNLLLLSGLLNYKNNNLCISQDYHSIYKALQQKESSLTKHNYGDVAYYEYLGSLDTGIFEVICKENADSFIHLYPNLVEYCLDKIELKYKVSKIPAQPRQQIFYGAPGTGKSFSISEKFALAEDNTFRTTFHPDTDYASFVGCYKPVSNNHISKILSKEELLNCFIDSKTNQLYEGSRKPRYWYEGLMNAESIKELDLSGEDIDKMLSEKGYDKDNYTTEVDYMVKIHDWLKAEHYLKSSNISYSFTPQVFTRAYIKAWEKHATNEPVFLVIDEINRGNCAQIFGDLFQLLDRDDYGYSDYEIKPDADLQSYIANCNLSVSGIMDKKGNNISKSINNGSLLKLPNNLYILATMNTSDQSLFPMDSAFKRRWAWKYVKIEEPKEDDDKMFIELEDKNGNPVQKSWIEVITTINTYIKRKQKSSDKQIGYWFVKSDCEVEIGDGSGNKKKRKGISIEQFRDKVLFFLFDDAFKDDEDFASLFGNTDYIFVDLFNEDNMEAKVFEILNKMEE